MSTTNYNSFPQAAEARRGGLEPARQCHQQCWSAWPLPTTLTYSDRAPPYLCQVMLDTSGHAFLIRKRQHYAQIWENEVPLPGNAHL